MNLCELKNDYIEKINMLLNTIPEDKLIFFVDKLDEINREKKRVYIIGNGGSSLNATHLSMGISIVSKNWQNPIKAISFSDAAQMTSLANDYAFEEVYSKLVSVYAEKGDLLVLLSSSGNSKNLINAALTAKKMNVQTFAFLGTNGGELKKICDNHLQVESNESNPGYAEDVHMILGHIITSFLENRSLK